MGILTKIFSIFGKKAEEKNLSFNEVELSATYIDFEHQAPKNPKENNNDMNVLDRETNSILGTDIAHHQMDQLRQNGSDMVIPGQIVNGKQVGGPINDSSNHQTAQHSLRKNPTMQQQPQYAAQQQQRPVAPAPQQHQQPMGVAPQGVPQQAQPQHAPQQQQVQVQVNQPQAQQVNVTTKEPEFDVVETKEDGYYCILLMPGISPSDIGIEFSNNAITVTAERPDLVDALYQDICTRSTKKRKPAKKTVVMQHMDRRITNPSNYEFSFTFEKPISTDGITADSENGILTINLPYLNPSANKKLSIKVGK